MWAAVLSLIMLSSFFIGIFLIFRPSSAIAIQKRFYGTINWRIEPISMAKEIRNTKIMGAFLLVLDTVTFFYLLLKSAAR